MLKMIGTIMLTGFVGTAALAQTTGAPTTTPQTAAPPTTTPQMATPGRPTPPTAAPMTGVNPATPPRAGVVERNTGPAAAAGEHNQAVATTSANAAQPAHGRNSFTRGEARRRIERDGYADVNELKKDSDGVWRGTATKGGAKVKVWLDYKGNVGAS